jgi:extracellular factor (EF) 3-hydroxypalmitic acid methyl ester biosynthesis protein
LTAIKEFLERDVATFLQRLEELDAAIDRAQPPRRDDAFHRLVLSAFEQSQKACREFELEAEGDAATIQEAQKEFLRATASWLERSWIAQRARTKPNGFAGDYEMLIKLYDEATPATGLGGYLDLCILDLPLARAVRTRLAGIRAFLLAELARRSGDVRILDIASGPCREYEDWPARATPGTLEIVALDSDPLALEHVNGQVAPRLGERTRLTATRYNALRTKAAEATVRKFGRFDVIYSVGLCDYLSDEQLIGILSGLRGTLRDGGVLYVAFKDCERYDHTPYQWHLDWFFHQRRVEDCMRLYEAAGFAVDAVETTRDETGIIVNFVSRH